MTNTAIGRLIFFGDSICVGQGVSIHRGWVTRLAKRVSDLLDDKHDEIVVVNASVNGNTTRQALERMPYDVQSGGVDILVIQFGMNDCNYWDSDNGLPRVSPDAFAANLREIVARGIRFGAESIILNNNHPTTLTMPLRSRPECSYEENNAHYNAICRDVALTLDDHVTFNDVERYFLELIECDDLTREELVLADGLHLSPLGHDLYLEFVSPSIETAITKLVNLRGQ